MQKLRKILFELSIPFRLFTKCKAWEERPGAHDDVDWVVPECENGMCD